MPGIRPESSGPVCAVTACRTSTSRVGGFGFVFRCSPSARGRVVSVIGCRLGLGHGRQDTGRASRTIPRDDRRRTFSPGGPPETVLDPEPDDALDALRGRARAAGRRPPRRRLRRVRALAALPRRVGAARAARARRRRGVRVLPRRLPPRPRPAAPVGLARLAATCAGSTRRTAASCARSTACAVAAEAIGEADEAQRCAEFLLPAGPRVGTARPRVASIARETRTDHRHHRPGRPPSLAVPRRQGLPGVRPRARPGEPEDRARAEREPRARARSRATCATSRR